MTPSLQICMTIVIAQWIGYAYTEPFLQGISFRRNFDISLRPWQIKPITFTKEKWGPFGSFGRKHSITKREAELEIGPKSVIPIAPTVGPVFMSPPVVTSPSGLSNEISISPSSLQPITSVLPVRHVPPAPVYEHIPERPFLPPPSQMNSGSSLITSVIPQPSSIRPNFFNELSTPLPISVSSPPIMSSSPLVPSPPIVSIPTVITPVPPINNVPSYGLNTDITQSIPSSPLLNILNPAPVYEPPVRVNLLVPNNDQIQSVNSDSPAATATRRGILARFGEFFLQLLTRFINATRTIRNNLQPVQ